MYLTPPSNAFFEKCVIAYRIDIRLKTCLMMNDIELTRLSRLISVCITSTGDSKIRLQEKQSIVVADRSSQGQPQNQYHVSNAAVHTQ
jgi:hypothetical protein